MHRRCHTNREMFGLDAAIRILDAFAAEHPGLGDDTIECPRCHCKGAEWECAGPVFESGDAIAISVYTDDGDLTDFYHVCPDCATDHEKAHENDIPDAAIERANAVMADYRAGERRQP